MRQIYLDHQSATPALPEVWEAMKPFLAGAFGNPSSLHQHGLRARDAVEAARAQMAAPGQRRLRRGHYLHVRRD